MPDLTGRVAVVTGPAGGIGLAVCRRLQHDGAQVGGFDVQESADPGTGNDYLQAEFDDAESGFAVVNVPHRLAAYNASKADLSALTRSMAVEWASYGVRVNARLPGYVDTELNALKTHRPAEWKSRTPLGRFASVADVAAAVSYLSGDEAGFFRGAELLMDGGHYGDTDPLAAGAGSWRQPRIPLPCVPAASPSPPQQLRRRT